jgi:serine/threonine-protein kinase RsbW
VFEFTPLDQGFALRMNSDLHNVDRCINRIRIFLDERDGAEHLFPLSLLAREALNNAMIHGNGLDAAKTVFFRLLVREGGFDLDVEDQGPGFAWKEKLQAVSDVTVERGRGHEIYRNFARAVRYNATGNALTLEYREQ